jgi:hypothetical protein
MNKPHPDRVEYIPMPQKFQNTGAQNITLEPVFCKTY